jgi:hypothetical protein
MGDHFYELFIDEAKFFMKPVKICTTVMLQHAIAIKKAKIKYPLTRVETIQFIIDKRVVCLTFDNLINCP